ncbi:MAG: S-layer homology domain-containing protein [Clostridia bacterium]|nr:S-layer homology domain-containing protein [Clostridia bacterium]
MPGSDYIKKVLCLTIIFTIILTTFMPCFAAQGTASTIKRFSDVPQGHWTDKAVHFLRQKNVTQGIGNNKFGFGLTIKRGDFVMFLVRLMGWKIYAPSIGSFVDNKDKGKSYFTYIETALVHGVVTKDSAKFRPEDNITKEEAAVMLVCCMGYDSLAKQISYLGKPYSDVTNNTGYITIVKDIGIMSGNSKGQFLPKAAVKKEEAAVMLVKMYEKLNTTIKSLHAFYAISSYSQINFIKDLDSVSFAWSRLEYDKSSNKVQLNMTTANNNDFYLPKGFSEPVNFAEQNSASVQLNIFATQETTITDEKKRVNLGLIEYILTTPSVRADVIASIVQKVNNINSGGEQVSFNGVVIDFECMRGAALSKQFNSFLIELNKELKKYQKNLYVAVHPTRRPGQAYFDGYDYKSIGEIADKVILMAHDYNAKKLSESDMQNGFTSTPLTPIDEIYYALRAITDKNTGVKDLNKIMLQISFGSVQWKKVKGRVIKQYPDLPTYEQIKQRLYNKNGSEKVSMMFDSRTMNPWFTYHNTSDNTDNTIWYEDSRSISSKIKLAKMFGVQSFSLWRLGNIPAYEDSASQKIYLDIWQQIKKLRSLR